MKPSKRAQLRELRHKRERFPLSVQDVPVHLCPPGRAAGAILDTFWWRQEQMTRSRGLRVAIFDPQGAPIGAYRRVPVGTAE